MMTMNSTYERTTVIPAIADLREQLTGALYDLGSWSLNSVIAILKPSSVGNDAMAVDSDAVTENAAVEQALEARKLAHVAFLPGVEPRSRTTVRVFRYATPKLTHSACRRQARSLRYSRAIAPVRTRPTSRNFCAPGRAPHVRAPHPSTARRTCASMLHATTMARCGARPQSCRRPWRRRTWRLLMLAFARGCVTLRTTSRCASVGVRSFMRDTALICGSAEPAARP